MNTEQGYLMDRAFLKHRFGNDFTICRAWISKVTDGLPINPNNGEALQDLC